MTQLAPDDVPESATAGTVSRARIVAAGEVEPRQEAPLTPNHHVGLELEDHLHDLPHDAERLAVGLEDDRKLQRAKLIAGVLSELALIGMLITSLQEPGRAASVVLAVMVAGLGLAVSVHVARFRMDRQPRTHLETPRWHRTAHPAVGSGDREGARHASGSTGSPAGPHCG
jgi:hypothetical protein